MVGADCDGKLQVILRRVADTPVDTASTGSVTPATSAAATTGNAALANSTPATGIASVTLAVPVAAAPAIGAVFGVAAALLYGVGGFMIGRYSRNLGWLLPVVVARSGAMVFLLGLLATPLRGAAPVSSPARGSLGRGGRPGRRGRAGGLHPRRPGGTGRDHGRGLQRLPRHPARRGLLLFRERLMRWQAGGAVLILAGLVLLGLGS